MYPLSVLLTLYNTLVLQHFNYCILSWGSVVKENHHLYLLQKKAVRIITQSNYIVHIEPLCKQYDLIKLTDMFSLANWKFYYKLMNNQLPTYFSRMKPVLPIICNVMRSGIRCFIYQIIIRHSFGEQSIGYGLIKQLNAEEGSTLTTNMVHTESFIMYKVHIKRNVIDRYNDHCEIDNCYVCNR